MPDYSNGETQLRRNITNDHLRTSLDLIRFASASVWNSDAVRIIHNFTAHDLEHSKRVANWADIITKAYTGRGKLLTELETYLLLAGIYLHDIGMQCDLNKWPDIKQIAVSMGAKFTCEYDTTLSSSFTPEQQQQLRSNHHYLAAAWIEYAHVHDQGTLGNALRSVPSDNVGDLMDICQYHAKLDIKLCPEHFGHSENRKRLVAAILRYADELDIDANRVVIDTVKYFSLEPKSAFYWWMHNYTRIERVTKNCLKFRVVMHTDDVRNYRSLVYDHIIAGFQAKNQKIHNFLVSYGILLDITLDSSDMSNVEENGLAERLPPEIIKVIQEMQREDASSSIRVHTSSLTSLLHSGGSLNPESINEQFISPMCTALAETYLARGSLSVWQADPQQVIRDCDEALHLDPSLSSANYTRGLADLQQKNYPQAIKDLGEFLSSHQEHTEALFHRGNAHYALDAFDRAIADYTEALRLRPEMVEAYINRGISHANKGEHDQAIADYTEALRLRPEMAEAYINRGINYSNKGAYDQAIADFTAALRLRPVETDLYFCLVKDYLSKKEWANALASINKAICLQPNNADCYSTRAHVYLVKGDYSLAIADDQWVLEHSQDTELRSLSEERIRALGVEPGNASGPDTTTL